MSSVIDALTGFVFFTGLVLVTGCVVARWAIVPYARIPSEALGGGVTAAIDRVARLGAIASIPLTLGIALYFVRQLLEFRDPFVPWREDAHLLLTGTAWGDAWVWGVVGTLLTASAFGLARSGRPLGWGLTTPAVLALGLLPAFTGHAAAGSDLRSLALAADVVHVWAAGAWIGGLAVVLYLEREARRSSGGRASLLPVLVPVFSRVAVAGVGLLILTGGFASWLHVASVDALFTTPYGRVLLLKLALVGVVLGLGARNARVLTPKLGGAQGNAALRRSAFWELAVAQLVLVVTAVLVRMSPMGG